MRPTSSRLPALLLATLASGLVMTTTPVAPASASAQTATASHALPQSKATPCSRRDFRAKIRTVRRTKVVGGIYRLETINYPVRTEITRNQTIRVRKSGELRARVSVKLSADVSAGGTLAKIVSIDAKAHSEVGMSTEIASTSSKAYTVKNKTKQFVPANSRIAWFAGAKSIEGTFQYSRCDAIAGDDPNGGIVRWNTGKWSTYGLSESGGIRCDKPANGYILKFAKAAGCS